MAEDFHDFEIENESLTKAIPEWWWRQGGFRARAFRSAIVEANGEPLPDGETLAEAFHRLQGVINKSAFRKLAAVEGMVDDEPMPVVAADIVP